MPIYLFISSTIGHMLYYLHNFYQLNAIHIFGFCLYVTIIKFPIFFLCVEPGFEASLRQLTSLRSDLP